MLSCLCLHLPAQLGSQEGRSRGWHALTLLTPKHGGGYTSSEESQIDPGLRDLELGQLLGSSGALAKTRLLHFDSAAPAQGTIYAQVTHAGENLGVCGESFRRQFLSNLGARTHEPSLFETQEQVTAFEESSATRLGCRPPKSAPTSSTQVSTLVRPGSLSASVRIGPK